MKIRKSIYVLILICLISLPYMPVSRAQGAKNNVIITSVGIEGSRLNLYVSGGMSGVLLGPGMTFHLIESSGDNVNYEITIDGVLISNGVYSNYLTVFYNASQQKINYIKIENANTTYYIESVIIRVFSKKDIDTLYYESDEGSWLKPSEWSNKQMRIVQIIVISSFIGIIWGVPKTVKLLRDIKGWDKLAGK